ncbi:MAG: T9SS type A sorting domain-containing protein [Phycisphaerae bacterium]|nr:T9SS type A sorting domain-containing protein [Saprospiraceae bacterium]
MTNLGGSNSGGHLYRQFTPGWDSTVFVRYYVKYPAISQGYIHHEAVWFGGYNPATPWPNPQAGTCGLGDSRISVSYEPVGAATMNTYLYWGGMHNDPNGNCWGNVMIRGDSMPAAVPYDEWLCVEVMLKLNNPATASNGELQIWHNGVEVGHWGPGFPNGSWTWDKFNVNPNDPPFPGFRWRTDPNLNLNYVWIEYYDDQSPNGVSHYIKYDHLVVAKKRIGPIYNISSSKELSPAPPFVRVSPNPATDFLHLSFNDDISEASVYLYDSFGNQVSKHTISTFAADLDISSLMPGFYVLEIRSAMHSDFRKIMKL